MCIYNVCTCTSMYMHTIYYAHVHVHVHVQLIYMIVQFTCMHVYMQYCVHCKYDCLPLSPTAPSSTSTDGGQQEIRADDPAPHAGREAQTEGASSAVWGRVWPVWFRPVLDKAEAYRSPGSPNWKWVKPTCTCIHVYTCTLYIMCI